MVNIVIVKTLCFWKYYKCSVKNRPLAGWVILFCFALCFTQEPTKVSPQKKSIPLPPYSNGGLAGLWYHDHLYLKKEYGDFELLNYKNQGFTKSDIDSLQATSWKLFTMGNFTSKELSYATLARVKNNNAGILLIVFQWHDPADSSQTHGIIHQTFIDKEKILIRTKQSLSGAVDTLEFSCGDLHSTCGRCFFDVEKKQMVINLSHN